MVNAETVIWQRLGTRHWQKRLHALVEEHFQRTGSQRARAILDDWTESLSLFWQVCPKEMMTRLEFALTESEAAASM
jgi:glutamate synthase (NADPH/NADH) large chain